MRGKWWFLACILCGCTNCINWFSHTYIHWKRYIPRIHYYKSFLALLWKDTKPIVCLFGCFRPICSNWWAFQFNTSKLLWCNRLDAHDPHNTPTPGSVTCLFALNVMVLYSECSIYMICWLTSVDGLKEVTAYSPKKVLILTSYQIIVFFFFSFFL